MGERETRLLAHRNVSVDNLRALAVLFMILVHAAATWMPSTASKTSLIAYAVAGIGGLAAPLFVTLFGWGIAASTSLTTSKILQRAGILALCQLAVNLAAPHLFDPLTPGVLTLFSLLYLSAPLWKTLGDAPKIEFLTIVSFLILPFFLIEFMGPSSWNSRIETTTASTLVAHLFLTGQYPLFPWLVFALLGAHLYRQPMLSISHTTLLASSFIVSLATIWYAADQNRPWALATDPSNTAVLTFFPATTTFLFAALLGVLLLWFVCYQRFESNLFVPLGQMSLTIYVIHFIPIGLFHETLSNQSNTLLHYTVITLYTLAWIPLARLWLVRFPHQTIESLFRRRQSNSSSDE
jgi:surface polysaccharide O-acyltransferase-like enzyme